MTTTDAQAAQAAQTLAVGRQLVELCRQGKFMDVINSLYSPDVVSVEACGDESMPAEQQGIDAIRAKNKWWAENHEVHGCEVVGPFPHGDRFIVLFKIDVTPAVGPMANQRMTMEEAGLYTVADGKIVGEAFFYTMEG